MARPIACAAAPAGRATATRNRRGRVDRRGIVAQHKYEPRWPRQHRPAIRALALEDGRPPATHGAPAMKLEIELGDPDGKKKRVVEFERKGDTCQVAIDGKPMNADAVQVSPNAVSVTLDGQSFEIHLTRSIDGKMKLQCGPHEF